MNDYGALPSDCGDPAKKSPNETLLMRVGAAIEIVLVALLGFLTVPFLLVAWKLEPNQILTNSKYVVTLMFSESTVTLLLIWFILRARGQRFFDLGLRFESWKREALVGLASVPFLFLLVFLIRVFFSVFYPEYVTEENPLLNLVQTPWDLLLFFLSSLFVGGFKEEVQRSFVLNRFESHLGGKWLGLLLWSGFFGYGHVVQGVDNAVAAGFLGLVFGSLIIWRKGLVSAVVAHAAFDVSTLVLFWFFWDPYLSAS